MGKSREMARLPNAPVFSASRTTSQSITDATWTKTNFNVEDFDTASAYDNATNFRFQPQVAGYYDISGMVYFSGTNLTQAIARIYKNGVADRMGVPTTISAANECAASVQAVIYLNGTTDYVELWARVIGTSPSFTANANLNYFQGAMVRPA